ncbi:hypothetical protein JY409_04535 [Stenotrophomonas maltophilia]|uniref:hypothetical protein n=1 Tax=Stenotrophomonas sp. MA5 TaxID=2508572 RepID=UPI001009F53D|nr:hypothetical protein [Stenotrophomonas sp. MA5]MBN4937309.1 hypothetical protein [Stenotrophomonas maltophilia]RXK68636.1 hypothetical protein ERT44_05300 [Stenotrophomonas sp. MA5]
MAAPLKPKERAALLAAYSAPDRALRRNRSGFAPANQPEKVFTRRTVNWLDERALLSFDDPQLPRIATLTRLGIAQVEALIEVARTQALTA